MPRVFLVTGSSAGVGKQIVREILENGDNVIATARKPQDLNFEKATDLNFLPTHLDLLDTASIDKAYQAGLKKFGRIDVVINNGGYGLSGPFEDLTDEDIKKQMDVNFTGLLLSTRVAIKVMRDQSPPGGLIQQVTSLIGRKTAPWMSMYCASKFACEGFTEAVAQEMNPEWKIKFNCVELGAFRTDFFERSMQYTNRENSVYDLGAIKKIMKQRYEGQNGDPAKAAKVVYVIATQENPPPKIAVGPDAFEELREHYHQLREDLLENKDLSCSTDFDDDKNPNKTGKNSWAGPA